MKNKSIAVLVLLLIMVGVSTLKGSNLYALKELFIRSPLASLYVTYVRDGKSVDADHVITTLDNGMPIIVNKHDRCVCWFIRLTGHWDSNETRILEKILKKGFKIIEVGANFGVHTLRMADLVGSTGKIVAFGANPMVSKYLKESIKLNTLSHIVTLYEKAAGNVPGDAYLTFGVQNIGGGHLIGSETASSVRTQIVRLDDEITDKHIDLLKIDAEGSELEILKGARSILEQNAKHIVLMLEWVPAHLRRQGSKPEDLLALLKSYHFQLWKVGHKNLGEPLLAPVSADELLRLEGADILASHDSTWGS